MPLAIPARIFEKQFSLRRLGRLSPDVLDYVLFLPGIWLACALGISLRLIGPLFVVVPIGLCLLYAGLRQVMPPRLLSVYLAFCFLVGMLSKYQLFPTSWQVHFMDEAIFRQLIPPLGFFAVAWASKAYFLRRLPSGDVFFGALLIFALSLIVAPAVMFQQGVGYQGDHSAYAVFALFGSFINNMTIVLFFILGEIFLASDWRRRYVGLAIVIGIAVTTHFMQFRVLTIVILAALLGVSGRKLAMGVIAAFTAIYLVGINFIPQVMVQDPNDGLRLAFVADALSSTIDTYGIGIGYGKESVRWVYRFPNLPDFKFLPDAPSMTRERMLEALSNGVENSFVQALLRTGLLGFFLFLAAFFAAFPPRNLPGNVQNHAACLFIMIFLGCFVNAGLESPLSVVGFAFAYGYLLALRARALPSPGPDVSNHSGLSGASADMAGGD